MSKPTFVCVPGAWHEPSYYDLLDVQKIRDTVTKLVEEEEKTVILVLHSYAGMPGGQALENLDFQSRKARNLKGVVAKLVYINFSWCWRAFSTLPLEPATT